MNYESDVAVDSPNMVTTRMKILCSSKFFGTNSNTQDSRYKEVNPLDTGNSSKSKSKGNVLHDRLNVCLV